MKIIVAPNALKGSLSAMDTAIAIKTGILNIQPDANVIVMPIADGGDGMLQVLQPSLKAVWVKKLVSGPLGKKVKTAYLSCPKRKLAIIELASASGLALLNVEDYDINHASTIGVGELIQHALSTDVQRIILGIGGSSSNDVAMGIATVLGVKFLDEFNNELLPCAENLIKVKKILHSEKHKGIENIIFDIVCDVDNPLIGETGSVATFSSQKGATSEDVEKLETGTSHFARLLEETYARKIKYISGGGAAGGVGAGLHAMFNANLRIGSNFILETLELHKHLQGADLLITAEGKLDKQTYHGKAPMAVAKLAKTHKVPAYIIAGQIELNPIPEFEKGLSLVTNYVTIEYAIEHAEKLIQDRAESIMREFSKA